MFTNSKWVCKSKPHENKIALSPNTGKYRQKITPYLDTFYAISALGSDPILQRPIRQFYNFKLRNYGETISPHENKIALSPFYHKKYFDQRWI